MLRYCGAVLSLLLVMCSLAGTASAGYLVNLSAMAPLNYYNAIPEGAPFGGYKASGIGRETHKVILEHYTQMKNIMINLSEAPSGFYPEK